MAAEHAGEPGKQQFAAGDARRHGSGGTQEAAQAAAAGEGARAVVRLLRLGRRLLAPRALLRLGWRRHVRTQAAAQKARLRRLLGGLRQLGLKLGDLRLGLMQGLVCHQGVLDQHIAAVGVGADGVVDHRGGFLILRHALHAGQIAEELGEKRTLFGGHGVLFR